MSHFKPSLFLSLFKLSLDLSPQTVSSPEPPYCLFTWAPKQANFLFTWAPKQANCLFTWAPKQANCLFTWAPNTGKLSLHLSPQIDKTVSSPEPLNSLFTWASWGAWKWSSVSGWEPGVLGCIRLPNRLPRLTSRFSTWTKQYSIGSRPGGTPTLKLV